MKRFNNSKTALLLLAFGMWLLLTAVSANADFTFGKPVNLGPNINSSVVEIDPSISADGLSLYFSPWTGAVGSDYLAVTTRASVSDPWGPPVSLGAIVDSPPDTWAPNISADGSILYFGSSRPGGIGSADLWQAPIIPLVDFNGDEIVDFKDFSELARYWGRNEPSVDIGPMPWGDGTVDIRDVAVLTDYWLKEVLPPEMVAYWKLDEAEGGVAQDSAGDKHGVLSGNPVWLHNAGKVRGALQLNGVDDYVSTPFVLNPADGPFSAFIWVRAGAEGQAIISQASGTGTGRDWLAADVEDGRLMTDLRAPGPQGSPLVSEFVISDGDWHHLGLVWDGSRRRLYADGTEQVRDNKPQNGLDSADGGLYFGAGNGLDPNTFWSGLIDDVRIYDRALSAEAVSQLTNLLVSQGQPDVTLEHAIEIQEAYTDFLLSIEGVAGVAVGYDEHYRVVIKVLVTKPDVTGIPEQLHGVPVQVVVTEEFYAITEWEAAFRAGGGEPVDRTARFARPVPIGVSTGHIGVTAGTIACRLKDGAGNVYALSNNHIYARSNTATIGDNVLQPGPYDGGQNPDDAIGTLSDFEPINFSLLASNTIDAAIARCTLETLDNTTPPDGYGKPRSKTALARLRQKVQKYGRTTGLTEGRIDAVNAVVIVLYRNPDFDPDTGTGGLPFKIARFDNQILVKPGVDFAQSGDSGSLVITPAKKAVGLLFAGSTTYTVCNPIDLVLQRFAVTIDGQ